ncbi:MPN domain-containing protein isoform X2 [Bacillus rossius redtenbacheri]|uniref:MPN domain-containing protein isoform X2 n=1 Tax=Bacillus rossius redtenbacheri TaxID=93214 RepID=UPI002FDDF79D
MQQSDDTDDRDELDEDVEDEEYDEDYEESGERRLRLGAGPTGRSVTLQMLLSASILQPGEGAMSIEYLGQRFIGDLLPDGKIKSQETDIIFASPSAWAIHCRRIINPEKKSGCGWASVKYKGKKLDAYKNIWFKKKKQDQNKENEGSDDEDMEREKLAPPTPPAPVQRVVVKHSVLGNRVPHHDLNTLVECTPFSSLGKIQPFLVSMATNAVLVMDLHCHLTSSEVVGYLAGHWDVNAHNLAITHAFPCRSRLGDRELAPLVEADIYRAIEQRRLTLVGWYHSHPSTSATPTLRDIDAQLDYEIRMKGNSDASYTPCVGVICSPYNREWQSLESSVVSYWVMPPPETKPHEYGRPMLMSYSIVQDQYLSQDALNELKRCIDFYKNERDFIKFTDKYKGNISYLDKLKTSLTSKFPRDQSDGILWSFIQELVAPGSAGTESRTFSPMDISSIVSTSAPVERVNLLVPSVTASLKPGATGGVIAGSVGSIIAGGSIGSIITSGNSGAALGSVITSGGAGTTLGSVITSCSAGSTLGSIITSGGAGSTLGSVITSGSAGSLGSVITGSSTGGLGSILASGSAGTTLGSLITGSSAGTNTTITPATSLMIGSEFASALFASGKFPAPSSLVGLSGDSSRAMLGTPSLAMGGIFIPPVGFKLDNISLLKPISVGAANPMPSTSKSIPNLSSDIIPAGMKLAQIDSTTFVAPENLDKNCTVTSGHMP